VLVESRKPRVVHFTSHSNQPLAVTHGTVGIVTAIEVARGGEAAPSFQVMLNGSAFGPERCSSRPSFLLH
jgi:hypothetical protein